MKKLSIMAALLLLATTAGAKDNIDYVDPFIGTQLQRVQPRFCVASCPHVGGAVQRYG